MASLEQGPWRLGRRAHITVRGPHQAREAPRVLAGGRGHGRPVCGQGRLDRFPLVAVICHLAVMFKQILLLFENCRNLETSANIAK